MIEAIKNIFLSKVKVQYKYAGGSINFICFARTLMIRQGQANLKVWISIQIQFRK